MTMCYNAATASPFFDTAVIIVTPVAVVGTCVRQLGNADLPGWGAAVGRSLWIRSREAEGLWLQKHGACPIPRPGLIELAPEKPTATATEDKDLIPASLEM